MRKFANFFLILFVVDAVYSLVDELFMTFASQIPLLTSVRLVIAYSVMILSMVIYACLGIDRRLPKRIFLPLILYISWCAVAMWPLSGVVSREQLPLIAAIGQVALVAMIILLRRGQLLLPGEMFQKEFFGLRNTLGFTAVNLLLTPLLLVYFSLAMTSTYLEEQTAGFLRISPVGVYMAERSYHLHDKEIRLAGMMHIGKQDYYDDLSRSLPAQGAIILAEGVSDKDRLLEHHFNYSELADVIGLSSQDKMQIDANLVDLEKLNEHIISRANKPDIARADIDVNRFAPQTVEFLNMLGGTLFSKQPLEESFAAYNAWASEHMTPEMVVGIMADILDKRNEAVIASMLRTLSLYDTIIIPWGAMHMPAIEAAVLAQGFEPGGKQERLSLDFRSIPYAELWKKWSAHASGHQPAAPSN